MGGSILLLFLAVVIAAAWFVWSDRALIFPSSPETYYPAPRRTFWEFQSIDTMKYSRDIAREKTDDEGFDDVIRRQVGEIAATGATHVAVATPYDEEFVPFLRRWVSAARVAGLHVWFRGNFSGWEGWFGYPSMRPDQHVVATRDFIVGHPDLFEDGDAFSACPECENGGPGDPRRTGAVAAYRDFIIADYEAARDAFAAIGKDVRADLYSMNGDVTRLVMDGPTSMALGDTVTIDHYVSTPERLIDDIRDYARGGRHVVLGEFGAPIPDIHGQMTEAKQAGWIGDFLSRAVHEPSIVGMNYWLSVGGSTELWSSSGTARAAVPVLHGYYAPYLAFGVVRDGLGDPVADARVAAGEWEVRTRDDGYFELRYPRDVTDPVTVTVTADGYVPETFVPTDADTRTTRTVTLTPLDASWKYRLLMAVRRVLQ